MPSTYYLYPLSCFRRDLVFCPHILFQNCSPDFFSFILFQDWFPVFLILVSQCWFQDFSLHAVFRTGLRILPLIFSFKTDTSCSLSYCFRTGFNMLVALHCIRTDLMAFPPIYCFRIDFIVPQYIFSEPVSR